MVRPSIECSDFQNRYLGVIRGWNNFAQAQNPDSFSITDPDIAPPQPPLNYESLAEIRTALEELTGTLPPDEPDREVVEQTLRGNLTYMRAVMGERFDFTDYVRGTIGFDPEAVRPDEIEASAIRLDEMLSYGGLRYSPDFTEEYLRRHVISDEQEIKASIEASADAALGKASGYIENTPLLDVTPQYVREDSFGVSSLVVSPEATLEWSVNLLGSRYPLDAGRINTIAAHEIAGHALHIALIAKNIQAGKTNPILGAVGVHTPFAFQTEALAQNAEFLFPEVSWQNASRALYNQHVSMVLYDAQWRVNHDEDPAAIVKDIKDGAKLPFESESFYNLDLITAMRDNPYYRAYLPAYYPSLKTIRPIQAEPADKQKRLLNKLYNAPFTPEGIANEVAALT